MDGVLAEVSRSYRQAIVDTALHWGVAITADDILREKVNGNANNDWVLTRRLLAAAGVETTLQAVTEKFEELYQGIPGGPPGLCALETLIPPIG
ncbi:unnamed protein product, partial [Phaeothamnion confervicola]